MKRYKFFIKSSAALLFTAFLIYSCQKNAADKSAKLDEKSGVPNAVFGSKDYCGHESTPVLAGKGNIKAKSVAKTNTIYNTDFVSAGVGGMRGVGTGSITVSGISGTVTKALLYWHGVTDALTDVGNSITVNAATVNGTNIGVSSSNCWPFNNSQGYVADITALVTATRNGAYALSGFGSLDPNGASIIVFFNDGNNTNNRDVVIFDGNDSNIDFAGIVGNPNAPADPIGWNVVLSGINYTSGDANIQMHVADGQPFADDAILLNSTTLVAAGPIFDGTTVPGGQLWDIRSFPITSFLSPGNNTINLTTGTNADCLGLIVALIDLPAGAAPPPVEIKVALDVKPAVCPNTFPVNQKFTLISAILGTESFDVSKVDPTTIKLNGVPSLRSSISKVATPFTGVLTDCSSCSSAPCDNLNDLIVQFCSADLVRTFGTTTNGQCLKVTLTGKLKAAFGGTAIKGEDFISIVK